MFIRDCNNYIAIYEDGGTKRKGAYEWKVGWHQNAGGLVIPKGGREGAGRGRTDPTDREAMARHHGLHVAHQGTAQQLPGNRGGDQQPQQLQNTTRYYVAEGGGRLFKWMPPLKGKQEWRKIGVEWVGSSAMQRHS